MNKVVKINVYSENKEIYKVLHELMFETRKLQNRTICAMYEWSDFKFAYKEKHGSYPIPSEILEKPKTEGEYYKTVGGYIDNMVRGIFYKNISNNSSAAVMEAMKLFRAKEKDMQKGLSTVPYYKQSNKINLHGQTLKIIEPEPGKYFLDIGLISTKYKRELELDSGRFCFNMYVADNSQKAIVKRILSGEYSACESELRYVKKLKKFFLYLTYEFNQERFPKGDNVLGVDIGIKYPVYVAMKGSMKRWKITGDEIGAFRKQIEKRRYEKRKQRVVAGEGSKRHGRNRLLKPVTDIGDKVARFKDRLNHRYSKFIIDIAKKENVSIIKMEDLTGITENIKFLKNWPYYDLQQKIKYKAEAEGIKVELVEAAYDNQECSKCGDIQAKNVKPEETFRCSACGYETTKNYNAAMNIAQR